MKLWEAFSILRDDDEALKNIFGSERWRDTYFDVYSNFNELVRKQDRSVLDVLLPLELSREIASQCEKKFYFYPKQQILRHIPRYLLPSEEEPIEMTALKVHDDFGGSVIEEVLERGSVHISNETTEE